MKALILIADGFEDIQLFTVWHRLQEEGVKVTLANGSGKPSTGLHGYQVEADMPIQELNPSEYDILYIPGGGSPERLRLREKAVDVVRTFMDEDRVIAIIGHGAQVLISAGALDGKALTCAPGIRDDVRAAGAQYKDEGVVLSGNLISARSSDDLPRLNQMIVAALTALA